MEVIKGDDSLIIFILWERLSSRDDRG